VFLGRWGATDDEVSGPVAGDDLCTGARLVATRCITVDAPPHEVFPWLRQMGFGRAGWYSYDVLDNLGRRSARTIRPEWQGLASGDTVPGGPAGFEAVVVEPPHTFVLRLGTRDKPSRRVCFVLAYELRAERTGTRIVTRVRARVDLPGGRLLERFVLGPGDAIMLRRQLLGLRNRTRQTGQ
jgi:hypothetical protein